MKGLVKKALMEIDGGHQMEGDPQAPDDWFWCHFAMGPDGVMGCPFSAGHR